VEDIARKQLLGSLHNIQLQQTCSCWKAEVQESATRQVLDRQAIMAVEGASLEDTAVLSHGEEAAGAVDGVAVAVEAAAAEAAADEDWEAGHGLTEAGVSVAGDEAMHMILQQSITPFFLSYK
jgi:hypothetical protein